MENTQEAWENAIGKEGSEFVLYSETYNLVESDYNKAQDFDRLQAIKNTLEQSWISEGSKKVLKKDARQIEKYWASFKTVKNTWTWGKQSSRFSPFGWTLVRLNEKLEF